MLHENPYAAPQSGDFAPVPAGTAAPIQHVLFSPNGRVPRRVFWAGMVTWTLLHAILANALDYLVDYSGLPLFVPLAVALLYGPLIWSVVVLIVKRWHDRGKSGSWLFVYFIPIAGPIWSFVELGCLRGTVGNNRYGADPT